ncbi:MAG: hypothetical protein SPI59_05650 [Finegoldia sp.]|nr:hypothetical protein [Finegoldia sp.]
MKDFLDRTKIIIKKDGLWLGFALLITLMIVGFSSTSGIGNLNRSFRYTTDGLKVELGLMKEEDLFNYGKEYENKKITAEEIAESKKFYQDIIDKYDLTMADVKEYKKSRPAEEYPQETLDKFSAIGILHQFRSNFLGEYSDPENIFKTEDLDSFDKSLDVTTYAYVILFIFAIAMLTTSLEHITPFYEFKRMFPWSRTKDFTIRLLLGAIMTGVVYAFCVLLSFAIWKTYYSSDIVSFSTLGISLLKNFLRLMAFYLIAMGTGAMAGSFIGHLALMFMTGIGFSLITINLESVMGIFYGEIFDDSIISRFNQFIQTRDRFIRTLYCPFDQDFSFNSILALLLISAVIVAIAYFVVAKEKEERSGKFVLDKNISKICFVLAVFSAASVMFMMFTGILPTAGQAFVTVRLALYLLLLYISYRLFKILFEIKMVFR